MGHHAPELRNASKRGNLSRKLQPGQLHVKIQEGGLAQTIQLGLQQWVCF